MLFPWNTDAPVYYWPFATVGLIAVNTLVFFGTITIEDEKLLEPWLLQYGHGLHPLQWVTANFLHAGFFHLAGNMVCLWAFGLVVEGKLGWVKFLAAYLGIGIAECALEQTLALGLEGGSLGASAIVYGLIGMALVWAPENELNCVLLVTLRPHLIDMRIITFAFLYLVLEVVMAWFYGLTMSSSAIHLIGAAMGFGLGVIMLKAGWVDCENWDLFATLAGRGGEKKKKKKKVEKVDPETAARRQAAKHAQMLVRIKQHLAAGQIAEACAAYRQYTSPPISYEMPESELLELITAMHAQNAQTDSQPLMVDYLRRFPESSVRMRLKLAEILVRQQRRPRQALKVLSKLHGKALPEKLEATRQRLEQQANALLDDAEIELQCEDW